MPSLNTEFLLAELVRLLGQPDPDWSKQHFVVAYSGGCDSQVLLHLAASAQEELKAAGEKPFGLSAIHVHHGLSEHVDEWASFCAQQCMALGIICQIERIDLNSNSEQAAREGRYAVFERHITPNQVLLTAHHQDDQAETILLRLLRGSGLRGLASVPEQRLLANGQHLLRPLLSMSRSEIEAWAQNQALPWLDDESNGDSSYDRNYLRHHIFPSLKERWPQATKVLARSAHHVGKAQKLLDEYGQEELKRAALTEQVSWLDLAPPLAWASLSALSRPRLIHLIQTWVTAHSVYPLPNAQLNEWLDQVASHQPGNSPELNAKGFSLRYFDAKVHCLSELAEQPASRAWRPTQPMRIPSLGLSVHAQCDADIHQNLPELHAVWRQGGERIRLPKKSHSQSLKKLLQAAHIPPWERDYLPMLSYQGDIIWTPFFGRCAVDQDSTLGDPAVVCEFELRALSR